MPQNSVQDADERFEKRMERRHRAAVERLNGKTYRCERCNQAYTGAWVAFNGLRCDCECDGRLREVSA